MRARMAIRISAPLGDVLPLRSGLRQALPNVARTMAAGVRARTESGRDVDGRPFRRRPDGSPSTLRDSGRMVKSFQPQTVTDQGFRLAPARGPERRRAALHQSGRGVPRREWVGADAGQVEAAREAVAEAEVPRDRS